MTLAKQIASKEYEEAWKVSKLKARPDYYWFDAILAWLEDEPSRKDKKHYYLPFLDKYLRNKKLDEIDANLIKFIAHEKKKEGVKNRTINAVLQQIRVVLKVAYQNDMIDKVPPIKLLAEPKRRVRMLSAGEEARLLNSLPDHLLPIVRFALLTGLRMSNITGLRWANVDMINKQAWIEAEDSKTGESIGVPLNSEAMQIIKDQLGKHSKNVFTYRNGEIKNAGGKAWKNAVKRAGLKDFHFHDLRHVWATRHIANGTTLYELMELGGWTKYETVRKYAHFSTGHLKQASERIVTNLAQKA